MPHVKLRQRLLDWYDHNARALPWRVRPAERAKGMRPDPYRVWLSEVMLQQTTVPHATPYFLAFLRRWPTVHALAAADDAEVMAAWAGLGYYARARNLIACARAVARDHNGVFPDTEDALRALPGLGAYTAAAVAAIAFDRPSVVVDGNVERVVARLFAVEAPLPTAKPELRSRAAELSDTKRPGDWAQAMMDLGAMVCRPKAPVCDRCPVADACEALRRGESEAFPTRLAREAKPRRYGVAYVLERGSEVALVRRPPTGLLGGMLGLPTSEWRSTPFDDADACAQAPVAAAWTAAARVEHVFTHFALTLDVRRASVSAGPDGVVWTSKARLDALPSVFLKAARAAL